MAPQTSNGRLKAIEAPPPSTTIILATAAPHLLLPTILSRAQVVRLPGKSCDSPVDLTPLTDLLRLPTPASYSQMVHACDVIQKALEREQARLGKEAGDEGSEDLSAATKQEIELEAEGGLALWAQHASKQVLESIYLILREENPTDPAERTQSLLQAMNGIDRGMDLSTMLLWFLYARTGESAGRVGM